MDLIHYSLAPLILFRVLYTLNLLPYYLSRRGGVDIYELLVFQCSYQVNNKAIDVIYILMYCYTGILLIV